MVPKPGENTHDNERIAGRIVKPHGLRGELVVESRTDLPEYRFAEGATLRLSLRGLPPETVTVDAARGHGGRLLVRFRGISDADTAGRLRGGLLFAAVADAPATDDPDEFYDHQLEGLTVVTVAGDEVGTLREVVHASESEILVVVAAGGVERMIPFVRDIVTEVDLAGSRVVIEPPEGLLDL